MKHAPHSLLALLTVLSLSESAHGTGRPPAAVVVQRDKQIATDAILAQEYADKEFADYQQKQRQMAAAVEASLESARRIREYEGQMARGSSAAVASPADPRSRKAPRSGYGAAAADPTDFESDDEAMAAAFEASLESERRRQEHKGQMARASAASLASPTDSEMAAQAQIDEVIAASLESERRRQEHEGQMARASAASVAEDQPWFLPAGVSPGDSQAVRAKKKLQAGRVAKKSDGPDDDSEFKPD